MVRLIVIGGVAAGTKAASRARRVDDTMEIILYQEEPDVSISECGMPYALSGAVEKRSRLTPRTPDDFANNDIDVYVRHRVESIDPESKTLSVKNLETGDTFEDHYDRLIIATGAQAIMPPIDGANLGGVFKLRFLTDLDDILAYMQKLTPKRAVVVGGGYIGLEVAENLVDAGMEVSIVEAADQVAIAYGQEVANRVCDHLREKGVKLYTGDQVEQFTGEGRIQGVKFGDTEVETDLAIMGVGVKPRVELAEEAGVEVGSTGAILVDKNMKTNLPDVWAAGDCVETTNLASGKPAWVPLGDTANQMGRVAGTNAATGEETLQFPGVLGTGIFKVFDLGVGKTGLSVNEAEDAGFEVVSAGIESSDRAGYFPGAGNIFLKLIAEKSTGRLLGAECVGPKADKPLEVCATAIWGRLTITDLVNIDLAYAPPFSPTLSPVTQAATVLSGEL